MKNSEDTRTTYPKLEEPLLPDSYEIKVQGYLDHLWAHRFEGMTLTHTENGESGLACTVISGPVADQPALHSILAKIRDLNLTLVLVRRTRPVEQTSAEMNLDSIHDEE